MILGLAGAGCGGGGGGGGGGSAPPPPLAPGILYVKSNDGSTLGAPTPVTWRFAPASSLPTPATPAGEITGFGQRTTAAAYLVVDPGRDRLWYTTGENLSLPARGGFGYWTGASTMTSSATVGDFFGGSNTHLHGPTGIAIDTAREIAYVCDGALFVFRDIETNPGNVTPSAIIDNPITNLLDPEGLFLDQDRDVLYLTDEGDQAIKVFHNASALTSSSTPTRVIKGNNTTFDWPRSVYLDTTRDLLYVGDANPTDPAIVVFANGSIVDGDASPLHRVSGLATKLGGFFDMTVWPARDEIYVANEDPPAILIFAHASTADGNVAPREIDSPNFSPSTPPNCIAIDTTR
jgi:DNA-binding beta-propeller fold protein YncE